MVVVPGTAPEVVELMTVVVVPPGGPDAPVVALGGADPVVVAPGRVVVVAAVTVLVVVVLPLSGNQRGSRTGVRKTMMHIKPARQTTAIASAFLLC